MSGSTISPEIPFFDEEEAIVADIGMPEEATVEEPSPSNGPEKRRSSTKGMAMLRKVGFVATRGSSDEDWRRRAACLEEDPELFFPIGDMNRGPARLQAEEAKAVCRRCEVVATCLDWALTTGQEGVWGATTDDERRALIRGARRRARLRDQES